MAAGDDGRSPPASWTRPLAGRPDGRPWVRVVRSPRSADDSAVRAMAARMVTTERGLIVVGGRSAPVGSLEALSRAAGWPLVAEATSGARRHDRTISMAHHLLAHPAFAAAHVPDLVLRVGRLGLSAPLAGLLGPEVPQVLLDPDGAWHDPDRSISELIVADVASTCERLVDQLVETTTSPWSTSWQEADRAARSIAADVLAGDDTPSEPRVARDVAACVPDGTTLVVSSSMPVRDLDQYMEPRDGLRLVANRGASGIDGFVSTAVGVALVSSGPTVALVGDLALLHDANGLLVAPDVARVDLTIVVVDNDGGGIFSFLPQAAFPDSFERLFTTPHGRDLARLAALHDLGYDSVTSAGTLGETVRAAVAAGGIRIVHVRTDRTANVQLHRRVTAEVGSMLDGMARSIGG